ncbi:MAG: ABC transporter ATP-binding protein [Rubrivivax sp.]|jgi:branched-chain amino acid transport system ATP-binding protein
MLELRDVLAGYGTVPVLHGVSLAVAPGEIVALLGRNGSGRSTTVKAIMGLVPSRGTIAWNGQSLQGRPVFEIARAGVGYVPEQRDVFPALSVHQNLHLGLKREAGRWTTEDMYRLFPALRARQHTEAGVLSGGEQQMLTLARTLMGDPKLILVDEPTEGLAPQIVAQVAAFLRTLREQGVAVLLVEQKLALALDVADRCLVMGHGRIVFEGSPEALRADAAVRREWLEV